MGIKFWTHLQVEKPQMVCATVVVGNAKKEGDGNYLLDRNVTTTYELCRSNPQAPLISSFPDFTPLLAELNTESAVEKEAEYQVTTLHPSGALVVKETFFEQFGSGDGDLKEFHDLVAAHNEKYNPDELRLGTENSAAARAEPARAERVAAIETSEQLTQQSLAALDALQPQTARIHCHNPQNSRVLMRTACQGWSCKSIPSCLWSRPLVDRSCNWDV